MVQFNPNLNVGKTVGLTSSAQVGQTGAAEDKQPPKAVKNAVWLYGNGSKSCYQDNDFIIKYRDGRPILYQVIDGKLERRYFYSFDEVAFQLEDLRGDINTESALRGIIGRGTNPL